MRAVGMGGEWGVETGGKGRRGVAPQHIDGSCRVCTCSQGVHVLQVADLQVHGYPGTSDSE